MGHFALRLANDDVTFLGGADGGGIYADVLSQVSGSEHFARKHLAPPRYEDFSVQVGASMSNGLFEWIAGSWAAQPPKKDGAILALNFNLNVLTERAFVGALIAETTFPTLDASSTDTSSLTVRFTPQSIALKKGAGKAAPGKAKQRVWGTSNFRLDIDGLDCTHVSRIDSFTVKRKLTTVHSGSGATSLSAGIVTFPNLKITLSASTATSWYEWHDDFVVHGHNDDGHERHGVLRFLSPNAKLELGRLDLHHLGIIRLTPHQTDGSQQIARVTAELYCEQMELSVGGGSL
jgi:hypothetical protein